MRSDPGQGIVQDRLDDTELLCHDTSKVVLITGSGVVKDQLLITYHRLDSQQTAIMRSLLTKLPDRPRPAFETHMS